MKKEIWLLAVLGIIFIILLGILFLVPAKAPTTSQQNNSQQNSQTQNQAVEGIKIDSPKDGGWVVSPLKITGSVNGGGWAGFEGQVGTVQLSDNKGKKIADGVLKATTDWTKFPTQFETTLTFTTDYKGSATLFFSNENPSGLPEKNKNLGLPVIIK